MADSKEQKEKQKRRLALQSKFNQRITIAKNARELFLNKDYVNATVKYTEYLAIHAELNDLDDIYQLKPSMFDPNRDVTELLLISHVYWEMARINEMTPKLQATYKKCISQFVKFTINQPYQVFNSEMLRKYIKKNKNRSLQLGLLNEAYSQIFVQSRKCYIASFCFQPESYELNFLRNYKQDLLQKRNGLIVVQTYYRLSSRLVSFLEHRPRTAKIFKFITRPLLNIFILYQERKK